MHVRIYHRRSNGDLELRAEFQNLAKREVDFLHTNLAQSGLITEIDDKLLEPGGTYTLVRTVLDAILPNRSPDQGQRG